MTPTSTIKSELKVLARLGVPVLFTQLGIMVVSFADTIMVGDYGTKELAAAAFVNNLFMAVIVILIGFGAGLTPILGALYTRGAHFETGRMLRIGLWLNIFLSLLLTVIMGVLYFFLDSMGQPPHLLPIIRPYYLILLATIPSAGAFNALQQMANSTTHTSLPMWVILISNIFNIIGNYALIYGNWGMPELGLEGAGISTAIARWGGCIALWAAINFARRYSPYRQGLHHGQWSRKGVKDIIAKSVPVMVQSGAEAAAWSMGAVVCGWFGELQLAAYQVTNIMSQIGFLTYLSISTAVAIRVANKMGESNYGSLRLTAYTGLGLNLVFAIAASALFIFCSHGVFRIFTPDEDVIAGAMTLILPLVIYQLFDAMQVTLCNALRGTGFVQPLLWISLGAYLMIGLPTMLYFASGLNLGARGVYFSYAVMLVAASASYWWFFERRVRKLTIGKKLGTLP